MSSIRMTQITALVLQAVATGYRHGFDIMEVCGLPSGTVYPALRRLERAEILRSEWENTAEARAVGRPRRRTYALTREGHDFLPHAEAKLGEVRRLLGDFPPPEGKKA